MSNGLKETLRAAMQRWEEEHKKEEAAPVRVYPFKVSNNLNRAAFQEIKDSLGTRKKVSDALVAKGYKLGSVSAVIGQMLRQGVAQLDDMGVLHVTTSEYVPLKSAKTLRNLLQKKTTKKAVVVKKDQRVSSSAGIAALSPTPAPAPAVFVPAAVPPEQFVLHALESMSVLQARAVYDELRKIFGDAK